MALTREQAIAEHRKMWRWIAEETEKQKQRVRKQEYLVKHGYYDYLGNIPLNDCFLCDYTFQEGLPDCSLCLLDWDSEQEDYMCERKSENEDGYYCKWYSTSDNNWQRAAKLAKIIAELPERKE